MKKCNTNINRLVAGIIDIFDITCPAKDQQVYIKQNKQQDKEG